MHIYLTQIQLYPFGGGIEGAPQGGGEEGERTFSNNAGNLPTISHRERVLWSEPEMRDADLLCPKSIFAPAYLSEPLAEMLMCKDLALKN